METMKKRGGGRSRICFDDSPEFFKVFIPFRNSQQLKIPTSFVGEFGGIIHKKTTLKGQDGKLWDVDVENTDEGVFMKNGWLNFVNHYSLRDGEFLVFKYIGKSTFMVKIFGTNGCKIEAFPRSTVGEVKIKEELEEIEVKKLCEKPSSSKRPRGSRKAQKVSSRLIKQKPVPKNPYFIKPVNYKQSRNLIIPTVMFTAHNVRVKPAMVLRNEEGKIWHVKVNKCADGRIMFGSGWVKFWKQNGVRPCDSCKFTFIEGGSSGVIEVEILRGQAE